MHRILMTLLSLELVLAYTGQAQAQSVIEVTNVHVVYVFGEQITFQASLQPASAVNEAYLFFQVEADENTHTVPLSLAEDGHVEYRHNIPGNQIRPFARVFFWYRVILTSGESVDSPHFFFRYDDDRYPWQVLENDRLRVHWYAGDVSFGQAALHAADMGYQTLDALLAPILDGPVDVFIYASASDVQDMLGLGGYSWVGPELGVVLVSIVPAETQEFEMQRQIPHELAHVWIYRLIGPSHAQLPTWLVEGIASVAEQVPNSDYTQVLMNASQNNALLDIANLCGPFPADASGVHLAYAESVSFTRYLLDTYGTTGLQAVLNAYPDGISCEEGTQNALGLPLGQLDLHWRQSTLGEEEAGQSVENPSPYFVILAIILLFPAWGLGLGLKKKEKKT